MISTVMEMPEDFLYKSVIEKGPPHHEPYDDFWIKHPPMPPSRRAKIFSPFAALRGYEEKIADTLVEYEQKKELTEGEIEELDRKLNILWKLTRNSVELKRVSVRVSVTYYVPCADKDSKAYGTQGRYITEQGVVRQVTPKVLRLDEKKIPLKDILSLESDCEIDGREIFAEPWEGGCDW